MCVLPYPLIGSIYLNCVIMKDEQFNFIVKVSEFIQRFGVLTPVADWIGCQFAMESNYGQSRIARERNNFCGMKVPSIRPSLNTALSGFASYDSFESCCIDYMLLLAYNRFGYNQLSDVELFTLRLKAVNYCPEQDYIQSITNLYNQFKNYRYAKRK